MRVLLKILVGLLVLLSLVCVVIVVLPDQQYQSITKKVVEYLTDRELSIAGLKTTRSLNPTIQIESAELSNAEWADQPNMIEAENLFASIDLIELIKGKFKLHNLSADLLNIDLIKNEQGLANWDFEKLKSNPDKKFNLENLAGFNLSEFNLENAKFQYLDRQKRIKYRLELPTLTLSQNEQANSQKIAAQGLFNELPFSINGEAGLIDSIAVEKSLPFNLETTLNESKVNLLGSLDHSNDTFLLKTKAAAQTRSLADLSVFMPRELPEIGPINIVADVAGDLKNISKQGIDIRNLDVKVDDPTIDLEIKGQLQGLAAKNEGEIDIDLDVTDLTKLLELAGLKKAFPGTLKLKATASGSGKNFSLDINEAMLDSKLLQAQVTGNINDLLNGADAEVNIKADAPNLDIVTQLFNQKMPPEWGPIKATATLIGKNKQYAIEGIQAELNGRSKAKVSGRIDGLIGFDSMQLDAEATLSTLAEISAFTPQPLPDMGPMTATGTITWQDGNLALVDAQANYSGQYGKADVSGSIGDLIRFDIVRLKADANIPNLSVVEAFSGLEMPKVGSINAKADLISPVARDLSAKKIVASYDNNGVILNASGSIDSMIKKRAQLNLNVDASLNSLASLSPVFEAKLPEIGPLTASAKIIGATTNIEITDITAELTDSALQGNISGNLGRVVDLKDINLQANLNAPSVQQLLNRFDIKSDIKRPASLSSHVNYGDGALHLTEAELDLADGKIIGDLSMLNYLDKSKRPKLVGKINVMNFDLLEAKKKKSPEKKKKPQNTTLSPKRSDSTDFAVVEEVDVNDKNQEQTNTANDEKFLPDDPLPFDLIRDNDLDLKLKIGRLRANVFDFENATVDIKSNNGVFQFGPFDGTLGGGQALLQLDINARTRPAVTSFNARIDGFNMAKAGAFRDSENIESSGDAFASLVINGAGESIASILSDANGGGLLYFEDMLLKKGTIDLFTTDLFKKTLNAINPFKKKEKDTEIECAAFAFNIEDGLFTTPYGVAAEAKDYSMTGNGQVNFKTETVDLEFKTKVKKLLAINPLEKLTGLVKVKGRLTDPQVTLNPKGIFEIGATIGAALATGGLSLLAQDQYEKMKAKSHLCAQALGQAS